MVPQSTVGASNISETVLLAPNQFSTVQGTHPAALAGAGIPPYDAMFEPTFVRSVNPGPRVYLSGEPMTRYTVD
eukprot:6173404-Pleurochrysis_carterae.AAC.3